MTGMLTGFAIVLLPIVLGWIAARFGILGGNPRDVLARLVFFFLSPFLLFSVLSHADVATLFSTLLPISLVAAVSMFLIFAVVARLVWKRPLGEVVIGALSSGYVNAANIGIPISAAMFGDAALAAPVMLVQLLIFMPLSFMLLEAQGPQRMSVPRIIWFTLRNPMLIGATLGVVVSTLGVTIPDIVMLPIDSVAAACVPVMLFSYGLSLPGQRVLTTTGRRRDVILASALKSVGMPLLTWVLATLVFRLSPEQTLIVTILAVLPTAQNVFNYAQRYRVGEVVARDTVFITTLLAAPVLLVLAALLAP